MAVLTRRNRTVAFRLSADEYRELQEFCCSVGARSVSEFAREAVHKVMGSSHGGLYPLINELKTLVRQHGELSQKVSEISGRLDARDRNPSS